MSASRDVLARVCKVPEEEVRCVTCIHSVPFINDAYLCKLWNTNTILGANDFCSFWENGGDGRMNKETYIRSVLESVFAGFREDLIDMAVKKLTDYNEPIGRMTNEK